MRIAVLSDIHANLPALEAVLADTRARRCARIYHAGDLIGIGPYPAEVIDVAREARVACVQGNHDQLLITGIPLSPTQNMSDGEFMHQHWTHSRLDLERRKFVQSFPYIIEEQLEGVHVACLHFALAPSGDSFLRANPRGTDEEILDLFRDTPGSLICFGHIHPRRFNGPYGGRHFLNPGGVGISHDSTAAYAVVELGAGRFSVELHKVTYDRRGLLARYDELEIPDRGFIRKTFFGVAG